MKLLLIDTETNTKEDAEVIEIACVFFETTTKTLLQSLSTLIPFEKDNEFLAINRITKEMASYNVGHIAILDTIKELMLKADYCVSYNIEFDQPLVEDLLGINCEWLCAMKDFKFSHYKPYPSLIDLALSYNIPILNTHRALGDCLILARLFRSVNDFDKKIEEAIARKESPREIITADIAFEDREIAKENGFYFDQDTKSWVKELATIDLGEIESYPDILQTAIKRAKSPKKKVIALVSYDDRELAKKHGFHFDKADKNWQKEIADFELEETISQFPFKYMLK